MSFDQHGHRLSPTPGTQTGRLNQEPSLVQSGLRLANFATSGQDFIKTLTGYDINNLPGYISTPLDILANPVGIASLITAIPTGGASLAAASAGSVGRRLATRAAIDVASGIAGAEAGKLAAEYTPGPDYLKAGAGLLAGGLIGHKTSGILGTKIAANFAEAAAKEAQMAGVGADTARATYTKRPSEFDPYRIVEPASDRSVSDQVADYLKDITGKGIKRNAAKDFVDSMFESDKEVARQANAAKLMAKKVADDLGIFYGKYRNGEMPLITVNDVVYPAQDVLENPAMYGLTGERLDSARELNNFITDFALMHNRFAAPSMQIGMKSVGPDGVFMPRGNTLDDGLGFLGDTSKPFERTRVIGGRPSTQRTRQYESMASAAEDGQSYPKFEDAIADYVTNVGKSTNAQYASRKLMSMVDAQGNHIFGTPDVFVDPDIRRAYTQAGGAKARMEYEIKDLESKRNLNDAKIRELSTFAQDFENMEAEAFGRNRPISYGPTGRSDAHGNIIKAQHDPKTGAITVDRDEVLSSFDEAPWSKPRELPDGTQATPMPKEQFATPEEWLQFVEAHERAHTVIQRKPGESLGTYEDRINKLALQSTDPQQFSVAANDLRGHMQMLADERNNFIDQIADTKARLDQHIGGDYTTAQDVYRRAYEQVRNNPFLEQVQGLAPMMKERGEEVFGPKAFVDAINATINPTGPIAQATKLSKGFNQSLNAFHQVADLSDFGRLVPTMGMMHPFDTLKGIATGIKTTFSPTAVIDDLNSLNKIMRNNNVFLESASGTRSPITWQDIIKYGGAIGNPDIDVGILEKLPGSAIIRKLSGVTNQGVTSMRMHAISTELMNRAHAGLPITPEVLENVIKGVNLTGGVPIGKGVKGVELMIGYPNWLQSQIEFIINAAAGMVPGARFEQQYARNAMLRLVGLGLASTYAVNALGGHKTQVINDKGEFQVPKMRIGDTEINVFGPYGALVNAMYSALKPGGSIEPLLRSRMSPMIQLGWDLGSGSTYMNDPAQWDDPKYWARFVAPFSVSNLATGDPLKNVSETILTGAGVRATPVSSYRKLKEAAEATMDTPWEELTGKQKESLRMSNPELVKDLEEQTIKRAAQGDKNAKAAIEIEKLNEELYSQQSTLNKLWQSGQISSVQLRDQLEQLTAIASAEKQRIRKDYGLDSTKNTPTEVQAALNGYFDLYNQADRGILAGGAKVGVVDWDKLQKLQADYMSTLTATQQKAITDRFVKHSPDLDWYFNNKQIIQNSDYFKNKQVAFDKLVGSIQSVVPGAENYSDVQEALREAERKGDKLKYFKINALIARINQQTSTINNQLLRKNPTLYKALVENGYLQQARSQSMAAAIQ